MDLHLDLRLLLIILDFREHSKGNLVVVVVELEMVEKAEVVLVSTS